MEETYVITEIPGRQIDGEVPVDSFKDEKSARVEAARRSASDPGREFDVVCIRIEVRARFKGGEEIE